MKIYKKLSIYLLFMSSVFAYIEPGVGTSTFIIVFGIIIAILLGLISILWYPVKKFINRRKQ